MTTKVEKQLGELITLIRLQAAPATVPAIPAIPAIAPIPAIPAIPAIPPVFAISPEAFTRLETTVKLGFEGVNSRIDGIKDGTSRQLADHEERLRTVETSATVSKTNRQNEVKESNNRITYWGLAITVVLGLLEVLLRYAK
jgi:hypothetical protein